MEPHQERVASERIDLHKKYSALDVFIRSNPVFSKLPPEERDRLTRQLNIMAEYLKVLDDRIAAFPKP